MTGLTRVSLTTLTTFSLFIMPAYASESDNSDNSTEQQSETERELEELLEGRVAGQPESCIYTRPNSRMRVIDNTAIVYGRGKTIYVNRTARPENLDDRDTMVIRRFSGSQLCRQDIITTVDAFSGMYTGNIFLSDFVPYTRVDSD